MIVERLLKNTLAVAARIGGACVMLWFCLGGVDKAQAGATNIVEYQIQPYQNYVMERIVSGPDGAYWFAEFFYGIGRIAVSNGVAVINPNPFTHYPDTTNIFGRPESIVVGPDQNLWFTEFNSNRVCRITTNGTITGWQLNTNAHPTGITVGPDGNLWFLEYGLNMVATITTNGITTNGITTNAPLKEYGPVATNSLLYNIATGPDGNLWFTEALAGKIGSITTAGAITEYTLPATNCGPYDIVAGPDGALWFTEFSSNKLGRITTSGAVTEFQMPVTTNQFTFYTNNPNGILLGPDNNIWYADKGAGFIGRFNPTNHIITFQFTPTTNSQPTFLATGPDKNIWFCETFANFIGEFFITNLLTLNAANITTSSTNYPALATYQNSNPSNNIAIIWGDGTTNVITTTNFSGSTNGITIVTNAAGGGIINGSHAYATTNVHPVTIIVGDTGGATAIANITITKSAVVVPPPSLTIASIGGGVIVITWPLSPPGFELQSNPDVTTTNWTTITNTPGNQYSVTNPPANTFFRLIQGP